MSSPAASDIVGEDSVSNVLLEIPDEDEEEELRGHKETARSKLKNFLELGSGTNPKCRCLLCSWNQNHLDRGIKHLQTKHITNALAQSAVSDYLNEKSLKKRRRISSAGATTSSSAKQQTLARRGWGASTTTSSSVSIADLLGINAREKLTLAYAKFAIATGTSFRSVENPALHEMIDSVVAIAAEHSLDMKQGAKVLLFKKTAVSPFLSEIEGLTLSAVFTARF
jgi:hypothetical protein